MSSPRFPRRFGWFVVSAGTAVALSAFPHGVDTYNLMSKLFVEEYHARYAKTASAPDTGWAAYPVESRYAAFEDVYYLYLLSQLDPNTNQFPPPRPVPDENRMGFIVLRTPSAGEGRVIPHLKSSAFTLQLDSHPPVEAETIEDDPLRRFPVLADTRSDSCLVWFSRIRWDKDIPLAPHELRLVIHRPTPKPPVVFTWKIPDGFPIGNARYESDIWTVVRERYAIMPMPPHLPGAASGATANPRNP